jgi:hypothetical protein
LACLALCPFPAPAKRDGRGGDPALARPAPNESAHADRDARSRPPALAPFAMRAQTRDALGNDPRDRRGLIARQRLPKRAAKSRGNICALQTRAHRTFAQIFFSAAVPNETDHASRAAVRSKLAAIQRVGSECCVTASPYAPGSKSVISAGIHVFVGEF